MVQSCKHCEKEVKVIEKMGVYLCPVCRRVTGYKSFEKKDSHGIYRSFAGATTGRYSLKNPGILAGHYTQIVGGPNDK